MRYELADYEWIAIKPMLPNKPRGVPRVNDRRVLNGIFWVLRSGAPWRDLPEMFGPYTTCYNRSDWIRELAMKKGAWANIPPKSNRSDPICFSPYLYRARNQVERFFNRIKQCRRVATRSDRLAGNFLAFVQLASIRLWLAARYESTA